MISGFLTLFETAEKYQNRTFINLYRWFKKIKLNFSDLIENCVLLDADKVKTSTAKSKKIRKNRETVSIRFSPEAEAALADSKAKSVSSSNPVQSGTNSAEEEESPGRCSSFNNIEDINCNNPKNIGLLRRKV